MSKNIGNIIKLRLKELEMTNEDLAKKCGLSSMSIGRIINNKNYNPTILTLEKICKAIDLKINDFINEECNDVNGYLEFDGIIYKITSFTDLFNFYSKITSRLISNDKDVIEKNSGYCYIMSDENYPNTYKIGKSKNPVKREETLLHSAPSIRLYKVVKTDNMHKLEKDLHKLFSDKRIRGEWFKLSDMELDGIIEKYNFVNYEQDF